MRGDQKNRGPDRGGDLSLSQKFPGEKQTFAKRDARTNQNARKKADKGETHPFLWLLRVQAI